MTATVSRLRISKLHDSRDVDFGFDGPVSIFMGPNGIGKSTILNIFVHFMARQWKKLGKFSFDSVSIDFSSGDCATVMKSDCDEAFSNDFSPRLRGVYSAIAANGLLEDLLKSEQEFSVELNELVEEYDIAPRDLRLMRNSLTHSDQGGRGIAALSLAAKMIRHNFKQRILYLPTYRRIEQDLGEILSMSTVALRRMQSEIEDELSDTSSSVIELVRFGMNDIEILLNRYTSETKEYSRQQINALSTRYLTAALSSRKPFDKSFFNNLTDGRIKDVLARVDDEELDAKDRKGITDLLRSLRGRQGGGRLNKAQEHVASYFYMLAETHDRISKREVALKALASLLNGYIGPTKTAVYDQAKYDFSIRSREKNIPLSGLSSGEKQLVSLFATLSLTKEENYFVIIDEPELSLSVLWQELLLNDIISVRSCKNLLAVTHSPFIYGEGLARYTRDLSDFTKVVA